MDNGFCELIFDFSNPLKIASFVADLLKVFEIPDFASFIAIKQVYDVLTQCPFHGSHDHTSGMLEQIAMVGAIVECPDAAATWTTDATELAKYRNDPLTDREGNKVYLGFKNEYEEACASSGFIEKDGVVLYGYNFAWNAEVATREFWEDADKGFATVPSWWKGCPAPYTRSWWNWFRNGPCELPDDTKFLGESCETKSQCANDVVHGYVDVTCAPTNNDVNDPQLQCVFDEDSTAVARSDTKCECAEGERWCTNNADCNGNTCVLAQTSVGVSEYQCRWDMEITELWQHISPVVYPLVKDLSCSNNRVSHNACVAYGDANPFTVDTSKVVAGSGMLSLGCVGLVGGALLAGKRKKRMGAPAADKMESAGVAMV
jgi:hypothetical protein